MASNPSTPATSPQKPVLKQPLIDVWSTREKLALASCVHKQGDQNWYSVSRSIKPFAESIRPDDWFSTKNCALQYQDLLEKKEKEMKLTQPKRKRGERGEETPQELIVRDLTAQRLYELKAKITEDTKKFQEIKDLWEAVHTDNPPEDVLRKVWQMKVDEQQRQKEEAETFEQFKKERDEKYKQAKATLRAGLLRTPSRTTTPRSQEGQPATPQKAKTPSPVKQPSLVKQGSPVKVSVKIEEPDVLTPGKETAPLLTSLLAKSPSPTKTVSPSHPGFFTQAAAAQGKQLSPIGSPHKESTTPTSSAPTLCKLLDMPSSSSSQKIPALSLVESSVKVADSSVDGQVISRSESVDSKGDVEVRSQEKKDEKKAPEGKVESPRKEDSTRRGRGRKTRSEIQGLTPKEGVTTPASTPSSATVQTRRSARVRTATPRSDSESRSLVEDKKQVEEPAGQHGHQGPPESASEESMDSFVPKSSLLPSIPTDSLPPSPSSTLHSEDREAEREHRKWLKSINEIVKLALTHKHATQFADPVLEEEAEGYHDCVKRPMDLYTIRMRLENQTAENAIRTTIEFQQAMMLVFRNAQFFNPPEHEIYQAAVEMEEEILSAIEAQLALEREQPHIPPPVPLTGGKIITSGHSSRGQGDQSTSPEGRRRPGRPPGGTRGRGRGRGGGSRTETPYEMISRRRSRGASTDVEPTSNPPSTPASVASSTTSATPTTSSATATTSTVSGSTPASSTPATGDSRSTRSAKKKIVSQEQK